MLNPQQTTIDQLPDEQLATMGWNLVQTHKGHRQQAEVCERHIQAIEQEFTRRSQLRQEAAQKSAQDDKSEKEREQEALMAKIEKLLVPRMSPNPVDSGKPEEKKAE